MRVPGSAIFACNRLGLKVVALPGSEAIHSEIPAKQSNPVY